MGAGKHKHVMRLFIDFHSSHSAAILHSLLPGDESDDGFVIIHVLRNGGFVKCKKTNYKIARK